MVRGVEGNGEEFTAYWIDPTDPDHGWPVYPDGLVDLLAETESMMRTVRVAMDLILQVAALRMIRCRRPFDGSS